MADKNDAIVRKVLNEAIVNAKQWQTISKVVAMTGFGLVVGGVVMVMCGLLEAGIIVALVGVITKAITHLFFKQVKEAERRIDTLLKGMLEEKSMK